ncbi:MAG: BREX-3 system P-loop-containing protein BrxF [Pseudomonadota bacterium]
MAESLTEQVLSLLPHAQSQYYRLILLVAPPGKGKTRALQEIARSTGVPLININLELSRRMLDLTQRQRQLQLSQLLNGILSESNSDTVLLDNIEMLFSVELKQDTLRLLQGLSRNKTLVVAWNGLIKNDCVIYGSPEHAEYRKCQIRDFMIVGSEISM